MELTPQLLKDVEFREKFRGYDPEEVDEFLERVGGAVSSLQGRLNEALHRAEHAEANQTVVAAAELEAAPSAFTIEAEDTLRRTLILAQRTADAAIAEANETAARTIAEANSRASQTITAAESEAGRVLREAESTKAAVQAAAESEARAFVEATRQPLLSEISRLEQTKSYLEDDIAILDRHVRSHRDRLRATVSDLSRLVDDPSSLRVAPTPELSGATGSQPAPIIDEVLSEAVTQPEVHAERDIAQAEAPSQPEAIAPAEFTAPHEAPPQEVVPEQVDAAPIAPVEAVVENVDVAEPDPAPEPDLDLTAEISLVDFEEFSETPVIDLSGDVAEMRHAGSEAMAPRASEPVAVAPAEAVDSLFAGTAAASSSPAGDAFLEELRRAVSDTDDESVTMSSFFDSDDDEGDSRARFGRRR